MTDTAVPEKKPSTGASVDNLIDRIGADFDRRVGAEQNSANMLLKGHLLIENLLQETFASFDLQKQRRVGRLSFFEKVKMISEYKCDHAELQQNLKSVVPALYDLNEVRNSMAHNLTFEISENDVDKIGINFGSEYISRKYAAGHAQVRDNLLYCLDGIIYRLGLILFIQLKELEKVPAAKRRGSFIRGE